MKIRQQNIDASEPVWRVDKNVRGTLLSDKLSVFKPGRFQYTHHSRSNGHDLLGLVDPFCSRKRNGKTLRVHSMLSNVLCAHRQERAGPNMQRHERVRDFTQDL